MFRMLEGHQVMDPGFTQEAAATLCVRGTRRVGDTASYHFTRDLMLKAVSVTPKSYDTDTHAIYTKYISS